MAVYDSMKVNVTINNMLATGYAEGTMVVCERNEDRVVPYSGVKGEYAYSLNNNNSGTITVSLQQQSPMNAVLQALANKRETFPISVVDINSGGFKAGGNDAIILKEPSNERGAEITSRAWAIYVFDYSCVDG